MSFQSIGRVFRAFLTPGEQNPDAKGIAEPHTSVQNAQVVVRQVFEVKF